MHFPFYLSVCCYNIEALNLEVLFDLKLVWDPNVTFSQFDMLSFPQESAGNHVKLESKELKWHCAYRIFIYSLLECKRGDFKKGYFLNFMYKAAMLSAVLHISCA